MARAMRLSARDRILPPYTRRVDDWRHAALRLLALGVVLAFALVYGLAIAILPQDYMSMVLLPLLGLLLVVLWLAPDLDPRYDPAVRGLLLAYVFATIVWPYYLAVDVGGLPWITMNRLFQTLLLVVAALLFAMSGRARREMAEVVAAAPLPARLWLVVLLWGLLLAPLNGTFGFQHHVKFMLATAFLFLVGCLAFRADRTLLRLGQVIIAAAVVVSIFGLGERLHGRPIWADVLPSWLRIEDVGITKFLRGEMRTLDGRPRVGSSFGIPLYFGEFLGIASAFILHFLIRSRLLWQKVALGALLFFVFVNAHISNARSSWIAVIAGLFAYYFIYAMNRFFRRRREGEIASPLLVWAIPATFAFVSSAVLFVGRIRVRVLGGGQHSWSDRAREEQWERAWSAALGQPWGHGPGSSGRVIGWGNPEAGRVAVDSTHAWLIVDFGFPGLILFALAYLVMAATALRAALGARNDVERMALPAFAAIMTFLATRYGIASWMNIYLIALCFALAVAVLWRQRADRAVFDWSEFRTLAPTALVARRGPPPFVPAPAGVRRP